jgi:hypothetical protein
MRSSFKKCLMPQRREETRTLVQVVCPGKDVSTLSSTRNCPEKLEKKSELFTVSVGVPSVARGCHIVSRKLLLA